MGVVKVKLRVCNPTDPAKCESVTEVIVDTGSTLTWLPSKILDEIGIGRSERALFENIEGKKVSRDVGDAICEVDGRRGACGVVFGEEGDASVLGVSALERLRLEIDPVTRTLRKRESFLALASFDS